jgi:hypothetical protein
VVVLTPDFRFTEGSLWLFELAQGKWVQAGPPIPVQLGGAGLGWGHGLYPRSKPFPEGPIKAEGDSRSPAGIFPLLEVIGYAKEPPKGMRMPYRQATSRLRCVDDPGAAEYNRLILAPAQGPPPWQSDEKMRRSDALYELTVVVGYNTDTPHRGDGSCIFLHVQAQPAAPTIGCTAMARDDLLRLVTFLNPKLHPALVQMPRADFLRIRREFGMPLIPGTP